VSFGIALYGKSTADLTWVCLKASNRHRSLSTGVTGNT
jgi:hypothetical protein